MTSPAASTPSPRAKIRMYRQGLGDCFLIRLPRTGGAKDYSILIDCGVLPGTAGATELMNRVMADILAETGGKLDLLVVTHEHADHLSGFLQAKDGFEKLSVKEVWLAWTEDPDNPEARALAERKAQGLAALRAGQQRLHLDGDAAAAFDLGGILEFFGAAAGSTTHAALEAVRAKVTSPRYCSPSKGPVAVPGSEAMIYVLGPPTDPAMIRKIDPSRSQPETYDASGQAVDGLSFLLDTIKPCLDNTTEVPFGPMWPIPWTVAQDMPFFKEHYWEAESWRRVDTAWLDGASDFALQLDSLTNNTSLVIAIELGNGDVLLFAADAQVGNWLSWQGLSWTVNGRTVSGPDLLSRTICYKVGHHGSHNATLREQGLETMHRLNTALLPVDCAMAAKKNWTRMPLPSLVERLRSLTGERLLQSDQPGPAALRPQVAETQLYFELSLP